MIGAYRTRHAVEEYSERESSFSAARRENSRVLGIDGDKPYSAVSGGRGYELGENSRGYVQKMKGDYSRSALSGGGAGLGGARGAAIRI